MTSFAKDLTGFLLSKNNVAIIPRTISHITPTFRLCTAGQSRYAEFNLGEKQREYLSNSVIFQRRKKPFELQTKLRFMPEPWSLMALSGPNLGDERRISYEASPNTASIGYH